ncbi:MAG: hypothetical protein IMF19_04710 [Proteobacteria bacterium]|nr:hypothetical protein [Pseudomonadota bacterium]
MSVQNCGADQVREGQITQELGKAEDSTNRLTARIDELETQLSIVLHKTEPSPPSATKEAQEVETTIVPLAHRIRDHYRVLQKQGTRLGEILDRLEIR